LEIEQAGRQGPALLKKRRRDERRSFIVIGRNLVSAHRNDFPPTKAKAGADKERNGYVKLCN
jgi:hypothetical protein